MRIRQHVGSVDIYIDTKRIDNNIRNAQKKLNLSVTADCTPLVPFRQGGLRSSVIYPEGVYGGEIEWNTVYAHYIYEGILYKGSHPIKDSAGNITGWWSEPKKTPTDRLLHYHHPGTTAKFFEVAKGQNLKSWIKLVKQTAGKE